MPVCTLCSEAFYALTTWSNWFGLGSHPRGAQDILETHQFDVANIQKHIYWHKNLSYVPMRESCLKYVANMQQYKRLPESQSFAETDHRCFLRDSMSHQAVAMLHCVQEVREARGTSVYNYTKTESTSSSSDSQMIIPPFPRKRGPMPDPWRSFSKAPRRQSAKDIPIPETSELSDDDV